MGTGEDSIMIRPEDFYHPGESPSATVVESVWASVRSKLERQNRRGVYLVDRRSFLYGVAATVLLTFATVGAYSLATALITSSRPESIQIDVAYENAIQDFERFVPAVGSVAPKEQTVLATHKDQLQSVDQAILELKKTINGTDISPLKRSRLRKLYSLKLNIIQEMIEQGELEL